MIDLLVNEINKNKEDVIKLIRDNYKFKSGIYLKVNIDSPFDVNDFKDFILVNESTSNVSLFQCDLDLEKKNLIIEYMKERNLLSGLLNDDANKTIDGASKKLLSSVYQCLDIKYKDLNSDNDKSIDKIISIINDKGMKQLINIGTDIDKKLSLNKIDLELKELRDSIEFIKSDFRVKQIELISEYIKNNLKSIIKFAEYKNIQKDTRIKIFFYSESNKIEDSVESYNREYLYYLQKYMFYDGSINVIDGKLKGAISIGFNYNSDKPLIRPRRTGISYFKLNTMEEALDIKLAYDLLKTISDNKSAKLIGLSNIASDEQFEGNLNDMTNFSKSNKSLYFKLHYKDKYILDYDLISETKSKLNKLDKIGFRIIKCKNYLKKDKPLLLPNGDKGFSSDISTKQMLSLISCCWVDHFDKYSEYKMDTYMLSGIKNTTLESQYELLFEGYKHRIHDFLKSYSTKDGFTDDVLDTFTKKCIDYYFATMSNSKSFYKDFSKMINIKLNLLNRYRKGHELLMIADKVKDKILKSKEDENQSITIENDAEFYFLLGQIAYYIETQSKSGNGVDFGVFNFYTAKRSCTNVKSYLIQRLELYSYKINVAHKVFKNIMAAVLEYNAKNDIRKYSEFFYLGICSDNVLYLKNNKEEVETEE